MERLQALPLSGLAGGGRWHSLALPVLAVLDRCMGGGGVFLTDLVDIRYGRLLHDGTVPGAEDTHLPWAAPFCRGRQGGTFVDWAQRTQDAAELFSRAACAEIAAVPDDTAEIWVGNWVETMALNAAGDARFVAAFLSEANHCATRMPIGVMPE